MNILPCLLICNDGRRRRRGGNDNRALANRTGNFQPPIFIFADEMLTTMRTRKVDVAHDESFLQDRRPFYAPL